MRLELTGRHVDITPTLRRLVTKKLTKLERLLNNSALSAQVVLTQEKHRHRADITLHARGEKFLHGVGDAGSWAMSLSEANDKIAQQAAKVKGKWQEWKRRGRRASGDSAVEGLPVATAVASEPGQPDRVKPRMPRVLRATRQAVKAMTLADAAREMDVNGDGVVVFRDVETAAINVLYRRKNGELTVVETET
jgi:putative sigma-54 modulation protein